MMNDNEIDEIMDLFYAEAPYDFVLSLSDKRPKRLRGLCSYNSKVCVIYSPETFLDGLWVTLHELAHARIQHKTHSEMWDKEFAYLLKKYEYPRNLVAKQAEAIGPNLKAYMEGRI